MDNLSAYTIMLAKLRAHRYTLEVIAQALKPYDVTATEWLLIGAVKKQNNKVSTTALAAELQVTTPLISRTTKHLEAEGIISITKTKEDKRGRIISLTEKGEKILAESEPDVRKALKVWLAPIERQHIDTYINVLMQVAYKL